MYIYILYIYIIYSSTCQKKTRLHPFSCRGAGAPAQSRSFRCPEPPAWEVQQRVMGPVWVDGTIFHHGALVMGIQKGQLFDWDLGHLGKQTEADINVFFWNVLLNHLWGKYQRARRNRGTWSHRPSIYPTRNLIFTIVDFKPANGRSRRVMKSTALLLGACKANLPRKSTETHWLLFS